MALKRLPRRALEMRINNRKRPFERSKFRWIDQIRENLQEIGIEWRIYSSDGPSASALQ